MEFGLIGEHLGHSFSCEIHAKLASYRYELRELPPSALAGFLQRRDFRGINVTIPYKKQVMPLLDRIDPVAGAIGAVNTIVSRGGQLIGYNTDGTGHLHGIKETGFDPKGKTMVLVGAGGAATAIGARAAVEGFKEVKLFNRKDEFWEGAHAFAKRVNEKTDCVVTVHDLDDTAAFRAAIDSADVLTNATKVGMKPLHELSVVGDASWLRPGLVVSECVYNPHITKLLTQAKEAGCTTVDGYAMLLWQGWEQFKLWTGEDFPIEYVKEKMGFK